MRKLLSLAGNALLAVAMLSGYAAAEIQVGVVGPMSGPYAAFGAQMRQGARMAVDEINAAGGINGERVALALGDDRCDAKRGAAVAKRIAADNVALVIGHFCGGASIAASPVYARGKIIQIEPAATNPMLTEQRPGPGLFRLVPSDRQQAGKKVAIVSDDSNYGASLAQAVRDSLEAAAQPPVLSESFAGGRRTSRTLPPS